MGWGGGGGDNNVRGQLHHRGAGHVVAGGGVGGKGIVLHVVFCVSSALSWRGARRGGMRLTVCA